MHDHPPTPTRPAAAPASPRLRRWWWWWPLAVLIIGSGVTMLATGMVTHRLEAERSSEFERLVDHVASETQRRMSLPVSELQSLRALHAAHPDVGLSGFRAFVAMRNLEKELPGVRGLGLIERIRPADVQAYAASVRADGMPGFEVRGAAGGSELFVIRQIEPMAPNADQLGRDLGEDPAQRQAIESAILSGDATLTGHMLSLPATSAPPGLMFFVPIYAPEPAPEAADDRWRQLRGLVFAPIDLQATLGGVVDVVDKRLDIEIFDGPATSLARVLYDADGHLEKAAAAGHAESAGRRFKTTRPLNIGGRAITLQASTTPAFEARLDHSPSLVTAFGGGALTLLAAYAAWLLAAGSARVAAQVTAMTGDLDRLAKVARYTSNAVIVSDASRRITWVNEGFTRITGYTPAEAIGRSPGALLQFEGTDPDTVARLRERLDAGQAFRGELRNRHKDGTEYWIDLEIQPLHGSDGVIEGFMAIETDVTERRRATDDLRTSLALIDALFESIPVPVVMKDTAGRYVRMNRAYAGLFGLAADDMLGKMARDVIDAAAAERHEVEDRALLASPGVRRYELNQSLAGGGRVDVLVNKSTLLGPDGQVLGLVGTLVDIGEQKATQHALAESKDAAEAANLAKSAFLATMSHEIRTPMNGVLGMAELLSHSQLDDDQAQTLQTILDSATALLRLIDDILDFSKIEAGRLELEQEPVELAALVEGVCDGLATLAIDKQVALHVFIAPSAPVRVLADGVRVRQLLNNLAGNAIKFSAGRGDTVGRVSVRVEPDDGGLRFTVQDNGIGMDEAAQARLFQPFMQAEVSTTRRFGGTGLGLAICRRLVEMMNGRIEVTSEPGVGSTFSLWLPIEATADQPEATGQDSLRGVSCVVVDDGQLPTADLTVWLERAGAQVRQAATPADALGVATGLSRPVVMIQAERPDGRNVLSDPVGLDLRHLLVGRGRRMAARLVAPNAATLDMLRRGPLLRAVATLAGRASPEVPPTRAADLRQLPQTPPPTPEQARQRGQLILVAEDDSTNRAVILRQLALLGHAAEVVDDGEQALQAWRQGGHALLLTDLHMPAVDGYTLARQIRSEEAAQGGPRLPILALTANALKGEAARARSAGMDDYLTKPVPLKMLQASLNRWMRAPTAAASQPSGPPPVDLGVLRSMVGDDRQTLHELLVEYLRSAREQLAALREAWRIGDHRHAGAIAHKLKSASRAIGAAELGDLCADLERRRNNGDSDADRFDEAHFERCAADVIGAIETMIGELAP